MTQLRPTLETRFRPLSRSTPVPSPSGSETLTWASQVPEAAQGPPTLAYWAAQDLGRQAELWA